MEKEERLERQRQQRKNSGNFYTKKYEKTHKGFLMRLYRNMLSRISGVQKLKHHLYVDKELLDKNEFYSWALSSPVFNKLFDEYAAAGFDRKRCPSVDRINSRLGYVLENMEWVTHSENSSRGSRSRYNQMNKGANEDSIA